MRSPRGFTALVCLLAFTPVAAWAQWHTNGAVVCGATNAQSSVLAVPDGAGGAILVWVDARSANKNIYAQRINGSGLAQWTTNGVAICTATGDQTTPAVVSDDAGGAIVVWVDFRGGAESDIYGQRVNGAGAVQWTANGVALCSAATDQRGPALTPNGASGAVVVWEDLRNGVANKDIYATRVTSLGVVQDPAGLAVTGAANDQLVPQVSPYGAGGAFVVWQDYRAPATNADIWAARISGAGVLLDVTGLGVCRNSAVQSTPTIVADGSGGAVFVWSDYRGVEGIYAQRANSAGAGLWTFNGVQVSTDFSGPYLLAPRAWGDGAGGATISWTSAAGADYNLFAQRIDGLGVVQWLPHETIVSYAAFSQMNNAMVPDGTGGFIYSWMDDRTIQEQFDIYTQRVNSSGVAQWTNDGVVVCNASNDQGFPCMVTDNAGGGIVAWVDSRNDASGAQDDIYAQHILAGGGIPTAVGRAPSAAFTVLAAQPNPFAERTTIDLELREASPVEVDVFDVAGRRVRALSLPDQPAGWRRVSFDGRDDAGHPLPSGVYFLRVSAAHATHTQKIVVVR